MNFSRREFLQLLATAGAAGFGFCGCDNFKASLASPQNSLYELPPFGDVTLLHFTDSHAQLKPIYFREPNINIGTGAAAGKSPHLVGEALLKEFNLSPAGMQAYAFTHLNFVEAAHQYGKVGGFAHLATLIKILREQRPDRTLLLDGGDTWQGSATALWTRGQDMVDAQKLLGVDVMTGHWEFTYGAERVKEIIDKDFNGKIEFLAQNINDGVWGDAIFRPYVIKPVNGVSIAIIGQAYPYTPIANPRYLFPDWSFGINETQLQRVVEQARGDGAKIVVLLSHNGMDIDLKMARRLSGIDVILGGHTHDAIPAPSLVTNAGGQTLVINSGSHGKFLSVLDLDIKHGRLRDYRYHLLPVFANLIAPDAKMSAYIEKIRAPYKSKLEEKLAVTDSLLYRRGNFNGTFDQLILDALLTVKGANIAFSPGFRFGATLLPGDSVTLEDLMSHTAITYATTTLTERSGEQIKNILEDIADNLFNPDPYYQQGGDMVRVGGLRYGIDPNAVIGKRISDLTLANGKPLEARKIYKVAGWASIEPQPDGPPIWEVVAQYLRRKKTIRIDAPETPKLKGVAGNPGYSA